jgi:hypothetical protein
MTKFKFFNFVIWIIKEKKYSKEYEKLIQSKNVLCSSQFCGSSAFLINNLFALRIKERIH